MGKDKTINGCTLSASRYKEIKKTADAFTNIYYTPPIPLDEIAESQGIKIYFMNVPDEKNHFAGLCDIRNDEIYK